MNVYLVRHAHAVERGSWRRDDEQRPLSEKGQRQADGLVGVLSDRPVDEIVSSPAVRCVDTVAPLARTLGIGVEVSPLLAEGSDPDAVAAMAIERAARGDIVLCTHGDVIPDVLRAAVAEGADLPHERKWAKGSTWVLEVADGRIVAGHYLPPASS